MTHQMITRQGRKLAAEIGPPFISPVPVQLATRTDILITYHVFRRRPQLAALLRCWEGGAYLLQLGARAEGRLDGGIMGDRGGIERFRPL